MKEVHGHDVMQFVIDAGKSFTREVLVTAIKERFGAATTFYTCSARGLDAEGIVEFLEARGKFYAAQDGGYTSDPGQICKH